MTLEERALEAEAEAVRARATPGPAPIPVEVIPSPGSAETIEGLAATERSSRIGRTAVQVGTPAALVGIGSWLARLHGLDLDPGAGVDLPADVAGYFVAVIAGLMALAMNRAPRG